jgi:hypothetical protein
MLPKIRIIIAGSRNFTDYDLLKSKMDQLCSERKPSEIEVVSGAARGADQLGERWAEERGIAVKRFPAQWDTYGRSAGYRRNLEMAQYATHLVAFWDGRSKGTAHMIQTARIWRLKVVVVRF